MSNTPEADLDLEKLFLPAWAKESPQSNRYAEFKGEPERRDDRRGDRGDHRGPPRRPAFGQPRGPGGPSGPGGGGFGGGGGAPRGQGRGGDRPRGAGARDGGRPAGRDRGPDRRQEGQRSAPPPIPLPEIDVAFTPDEHGVDMLSKQIRITGRAYPLFDIAQLILQKPERHAVTFSVHKKPDGTVVQSLHLCALDESLWLSADDAVRHVLDRHFATFYQAERTQIDPPKGVYTFVAQCGMSGVILGPPNYHDYQNQLRRLHAERFGRMPFEAFKARVKIVKDEEVVKKWVEDQSWKTEFTCLNLPEPLKLPNLEEVEKHFRAVHFPDIIKPVETQRLEGGAASRNIRDREIMRLLRIRWEDQKRFPLQIATTLSQQFASRGLQFFKVNKTVTHVSVARPHYLDLEATPVSEGVKRIVDFINATPKCTHKQLLRSLAPAPAAAPVPVPAADTAAPVAEGQTADATATPPAPASVEAAEPSPEMAAVMADLHWLVHQGHVIEFANGVLETAKRPLPRPPMPAKKAKTAPVNPDDATDAAAATPVPEAAVSASAEVPATEANVADAANASPAPEASSAASAEAATDTPPQPPENPPTS